MKPLKLYWIKGIRSKQTGTWTTLANWEQYNGSVWVAATSYPGEISNDCSNPMVTILDGHIISINAGSDITIPNLTIQNSGLVKKYIDAKLTISESLEMATSSGGGIQIVQVTP